MTIPAGRDAPEHAALPMTRASREMRLLLCCARRRMTPEHAEELRALVRAGIDWEGLASLAGRNKMLPLLWWHLGREVSTLPEPAASSLRYAFVHNAAQMLRHSAELLELGRLFATEGIAMVPYKGPVLAAQLYGNIALRQAGDLDILVRRSDVGRARALLHARGYRPRHALDRGGEEFMLRSRYSEELERPDGPSVELHWGFTNGDVGLALDLDSLAGRLRAAALGGGGVPVFGPEDLLLVLCIHGGKHRWDRLEWICGVAELMRAGSDDLEWSALLERAIELGVRRMVLLGVLLAHDLLGAPAPAEIVRLARSDAAVTRLAREVPALLLLDEIDGDGAGDLATDLFRLQLRERPRDRLRFIWYRLTTPSRPESWSSVALGKRWLPVHGVVRPFQLAAKLLPALRRYRLAGRARG